MTKGLPDAVVFDLDGTLINSVPEVAAALNKVLEKAGRRQLSVDEAFEMVGEGAVVTLERAYAATGDALEKSAVPDIMESYLAAYKDANGANTDVYPGVREVLHELREKSVAMSICTNKPAATTTITLEKLDLRNFFSRVICPEDTAHRKPNKRHVLDCLGGNGDFLGKAVLIGDSETDMMAARNAGINFIAVSYGYSHVPMEGLKADAVIDHFSGVPAALSEIFS